ncbi:hypothetical protein [Nonomuraea sp. NPDC048826]|uniref:hypothetical protein n=1 Tax=Nonomuraea sp. NPDC048826 TaxID=3364347 RepID=UPI00370F8D96
MSWKVKVYISLATVAAGFAVTGYVAYGSEFSSNLLAEGAGIFTSIIVGFALVDKLIEIESRRKWDRVKRYTLRAIEFRLAEMFYILDHSPISSDLNNAESVAVSIAEEIREYADYVATHTQELGQARGKNQIIVVEKENASDPVMSSIPQNTYRSYRSAPGEGGKTIYYVYDRQTQDMLHKQWLNEESSRQLHDRMQPHIQHLRDVLTPRVIEFGYEPELIEALVSAEQAEERWTSLITFIEDDWGMPEEFAWEAAAKFFYNCATLADQVYALNRRA